MDKRVLDSIVMSLFSKGALIKLSELLLNGKPVLNSDDIISLNLKYGDGNFFIDPNPDALVIYKRKTNHGFGESERIGKLVLKVNNKLGIESM